MREKSDSLKKGFDMNYAWEMHHLMNSIAQGKDSANAMTEDILRRNGQYIPIMFTGLCSLQTMMRTHGPGQLIH